MLPFKILLFLPLAFARIESDPFQVSPSNYDKSIRPSHGVSPVYITASMHVNHWRWRNQELETTFFLRQTWRDERLKYENRNRQVLIPGEQIPSAKVWIPDTFISNAVEVSLRPHEAFIRIEPSGEVMLSQKMTTKTFCPNQLSRLQEQYANRVNCTIKIESYGMSSADLQYSWRNGDPSVTLMPQPGVFCRSYAIKSTQRLSTGDYTELEAILYVDTQPLEKLNACLRECVERPYRFA